METIDYNTKLWNTYMKKFSKDFLVIEFNKHDGFVIPCLKGMVIPFSIDNRELLFVSLGEWSTTEMVTLVKSLPEQCEVGSLGCDNIAVIIPESVFCKSLAKKFGYRANLNRRCFIKAFIKESF